MRILKWNNYTRKLQNKNRVILGNRYNGQWIKLSEECYRILEDAVEKEFTDETLLDRFVDTTDRLYFKKLLDNMFKAGLIVEEQPANNELHIDVAITHRCNLSCNHCCVDADSMKEQDPMDTETIKNILQKVAGCEPKSICLTGGEPLVRNDFEELLVFLQSIYTGSIRLMTNGTLINHNNAKLIAKYISAVDISLDGVDEASCSAIRGKGVFERVINSVKLLQEYGVEDISLSMVLTRENIFLKDDFIDLNKKLGTLAVPRVFSPIGRGLKNASMLMPSLEVQQEKTNHNIKEISEENLHVCSCGALNKNFYINFKGDLFPCSLLDKEMYCLGNMMEIDSLKEFIDERQYCESVGYSNWKALQPDNHEYCRECNVNLFCWHCLHFLDLIGPDKMYFTAECKALKESLQEIVWRE